MVGPHYSMKLQSKHDRRNYLSRSIRGCMLWGWKDDGNYLSTAHWHRTVGEAEGHATMEMAWVDLREIRQSLPVHRIASAPGAGHAYYPWYWPDFSYAPCRLIIYLPACVGDADDWRLTRNRNFSHANSNYKAQPE